MKIVFPFILITTSLAYLNIRVFRDNGHLAEPVLLLLCVAAAGAQLIKKKPAHL